jgi:hypothetical protein
MFETQDMAFASYLVSRGHSIVSVKREGRRVFWLFNITPEELDQAESKWPSTEECRFFSTYQTLKNQIRKQ